MAHTIHRHHKWAFLNKWQYSSVLSLVTTWNLILIFSGNHETLDMNRMYGFRGEVNSKYSSQMADLFTEVYNWLPLAHCINNRVLIMHGGLFSKDDVTLEDIRKVDRNKQPPEDGELIIFCCLCVKFNAAASLKRNHRVIIVIATSP